MDNTKQKTCENCKFYLQHYYKSTRGYAKTLGHCKNDKLQPMFFKKAFSLRSNCKYWQAMDEQISKYKENLKSKLMRLAKELEAVCEVLLDDIDG